MAIRNLARLAVIACAASLATACHTDRILGEHVLALTGITADSRPEGEAVLITLRAVSFPGATTAYPEIQLRVRPSARVFRREPDQSLTRIEWDAIGLDRYLEVWTTGVEERALIPIYTAVQIVVHPPVH